MSASNGNGARWRPGLTPGQEAVVGRLDRGVEREGVAAFASRAAPKREDVLAVWRESRLKRGLPPGEADFERWWRGGGGAPVSVMEERTEPVTVGGLPGLLAELPAAIRELLALGPMLPGENEADCRVCMALREPWVPPFHSWSEAACMIHDFHAAEGSRGEAAYRRCVAVYRAAGWSGEYDARELHGFEGDDG